MKENKVFEEQDDFLCMQCTQEMCSSVYVELNFNFSWVVTLMQMFLVIFVVKYLVSRVIIRYR